MFKNISAAAAAIALLSAGSLIPAQAGGSTSAASKYNASYSTPQSQGPTAQTVSYRLTEFSSSSAPSSKTSGPRR